MRKSRILAIGAVGIAAAIALTACSSGGSGSGGSGKGSGSGPALATDGKGKTLTVWSMNGDLPDNVLTAVNDEFTKQTGAQVKVQTQQWDGIVTKVTTALSSNSVPDLIDVGNTQITGYAATGGLLDITSVKSELAQGQTWLGGLVDPATVDGKLYGVPVLAGARTVIYNKKVWAAAGVTTEPTTYAELTADLDKIKAQHASDPNFASFYLPGQYWYDGLQWVWDAGGKIVSGKEGAWKGELSSSESLQGLNDFKAFQNAYSTKASQTLNTDKPDQDQLMADGKTAAIQGNGWETGVILGDNKKLTDADLGTFAFPGKSGSTQPVDLGGSDWAIPAKSKNQGLALTWAKIAASPDIQKLVAAAGIIPISTEAVDAASSSLTPLQTGSFTAAKNSTATPSAVNWATVESDKTMETLFSSIASGSKSVEDAASAADSAIESTLNK
ncbi:MAG TPA: extracellular solute-binding protein [Gryllotalpicola sp.]